MRSAALLVSLLVAASLAAETRSWNDTLRDVYVDGKLVRAAQTMVTSEPRMYAVVLSAESDEVWIVDPKAKEVGRASKSDFTFSADRNSATTAKELAKQTIGSVAAPDESSLLAVANGRSILLASHQSHAGAMTRDELWETAPVWRAIYETYEPDAAAVARLREIDDRASLQVVFATWCGDSKQHVPRLLKAIDVAANPKIGVELFGIGPRFLSPLQFVEEKRIINVPIVIASVDGSEVGRFIETPATHTVEEDIADILGGTQKAHPGRWKRNGKLADGTYSLRDANGCVEGTERFEIYEGEKGGLLVHSVISRGDERVETWAALDGDRNPDFAEVTLRSGTSVTRTRYWNDKGKWTASQRGDACGIVQQTLAAPAEVAVVTPATPTLAWPLLRATDRKTWRGATYVVADDAGVGQLEDVTVTTAGARSLRVGGRRLAGERVHAGDVRMVVHSELRIPLVVEYADKSERRLVALNAR